MAREDNEPRLHIGVAARMVGVHAQTLRYYERLGLVEPSRSKGNIRLYSASDVALLKRIKMLINDLGVNLAGVEVILRLTERMAEMEQELQEIESRLEHSRQGDTEEAEFEEA